MTALIEAVVRPGILLYRCEPPFKTAIYFLWCPAGGQLRGDPRRALRDPARLRGDQRHPAARHPARPHPALARRHARRLVAGAVVVVAARGRHRDGARVVRERAGVRRRPRDRDGVARVPQAARRPAVHAAAAGGEARGDEQPRDGHR